MALETGTYISSLNASNPVTGDPKTEGDDHLRLIKATILASFPGVTGAVTPTHTELNVLDGSAATNSHLTLSGPDQTTPALVTSTGTSLNVTSGGVSVGSGGGIIFSAAGGVGQFAAIKGGVTDLSSNSNGHLSFSLRVLAGDAALTEHWRISNSGILQNLSNTQTSFNAARSTSQTSGTTLLFDYENHDQGGCYNNVNGVFTAPVAGVYHFDVSAMYKNGSGGNASAAVLLMVNGSNTSWPYNSATNIASTYGQAVTLGITLRLAANNTVHINAAAGLSAGGIYLEAGSNFSGHLLG